MGLQASELRIGNWHIWDGIECQVEADTLNSMYYGILKSDPILLTEEWLLKLGFKVETIKGGRGEFKFYTNDCLAFNTSHQRWWLNKGHSPTNPKHVHQLQNLYFVLTGEELCVK